MKARILLAVSHLLLLILSACSGDSAPPREEAATLRSAVSGGRPDNVTPPAITGTAREHETLTSDRGTWRWPEQAAVTYAFQWLRCDAAGEGCAEVSGATSSSYHLTLADVGSRIRVSVSAKPGKGGGNREEAISAPTDVVRHAAPVNVSAPSLSGVAREGHSLTADPGAWSGYVTGFEYAWLRCDAAGASCQPIGASGSTYVLVSADVGATLRVQVTALGDAITSSATSNASAVVKHAAPVNASAPTLSGTAREGSSLTASPGTWSGYVTGFEYAWLRCDAAGASCQRLSATGSTYVLGAADVGSTLRVEVTALGDDITSAATSDPSALVRHAAPTNVSRPTLAGIARDGAQVTASPGTWSGYVTGFEYAWLRCDAAGGSCQRIGATGSTYVLASADVGSTVRVEVTALGDDISASATSNPSAVVAAAPPQAVGAVSVSGSLVSGELLTASGPTFNGTTPMTISHQWIRCFPNIEACSEVIGATEATYRLETEDVGMLVRVRVTASNSGGSATAVSPVSALIAPRTVAADDFDSGNTVGQPPAGWNAFRPTGTRLEVISNEMLPAQTPPFSVLLRDDSTSARPELQRKFSAPVPAGSVTVRVRLDNLNHAPMGLQLRTDKGAFLVAAVLSSNGLAGHDVGKGTVNSTVRWTPGTWHALRIQWFADRTFDAYLGGAKFAERVSFGVAGDPGQIIVTSGYGVVTGRQVYVDSVSVEEMPLVDDFEVGALGTRPPGWSIPTASGLSFKLVDDTTVPNARGQAVELRDDSTASRAEMTRSFVATRQGSLSLKALVPSTASAPYDIHLRGATDAFLVALRLGNDGKLSFNANPGGSGAFKVTPALYRVNSWNDVRIDWFDDGTFDAYLNGTRSIAGVRFGASTAPARVKVIVGTGPVANRVGYVDSLAVTRSVPLETIRGRYTENATFLAHAYVMSQRYIDLVPTLCQKMSGLYKVPYLFVNIGLVQPNGRLSSGTTGRYMVTQFLNAIDTCETTLGVRFHVVAWINGHTEDGAGVPLVDVTQAATRQAMVQESARFVSAAEPGSYVAAARRTFDGVQFDLEPSGGDANRFNHFKQLMIEVRQRFTDLGVPEKSIGFDAHKLENGTNEWWWTSQQYYEMAQVVDQLIAMTYSTGYTDGPTYQQFMERQVRDILRAVSGEAWGNDAAHPAPWNRVKVFAGFIAMAPSTWHVPEAENIEFGAPGADTALTALINAGSRGPEFFQGAAVYLHADGTGNDGFAGYNTDWWDFGHLWLGAW